MSESRKDSVRIYFNRDGTPRRTETDVVRTLVDPDNVERTYESRETIRYEYDELTAGQKNSLNSFLGIEDTKVETQRPLVKAVE